jgi:hypothetical protein
MMAIVRTRIARIAYRDCDEAIAIVSYLEAGNAHEAVQAFAPSAVDIQKAMFQRLLMTMMVEHDKPCTDREIRAFQLLERPHVCSILAGRVTLLEGRQSSRGPGGHPVRAEYLIKRSTEMMG